MKKRWAERHENNKEYICGGEQRLNERRRESKTNFNIPKNIINEKSVAFTFWYMYSRRWE